MSRLLYFLTIVSISVTTQSCWIENNSQSSHDSDSIKHVLRTLAPITIQVDDLDLVLENLAPTIDREKGAFLYNLDKVDSLSFDQAHSLIPLGKVFETETVLSIAFRDYYDYKNAFHIFNFRKPSLTPRSSFILYAYGGDAEDLWHIEPKKIGHYAYDITETIGRYNDIVTQDTIFIQLRERRTITIDTVSGRQSKLLIDRGTNLLEIAN